MNCGNSFMGKNRLPTSMKVKKVAAGTTAVSMAASHHLPPRSVPAGSAGRAIAANTGRLSSTWKVPSSRRTKPRKPSPVPTSFQIQI